MKNLKDKVAVVSGAGSGIGKALAETLAKEGCHLAVNELNPERLATTLSELSSKGCRIIGSSFDVADREAWKAFETQVMAEYGHVDIVINNAGVALGRMSVDHMTLEDFEWIMGINFWGMVYGTKIFLPSLKQRPEAAVANISSVLGLGGLAYQGGYCSSKFAIRGFSEALKMEAMMEFPNVSVHSIHPGGIKTRIARDSKWEGGELSKEEHERQMKMFETTFITSAEEAAKVIIRGIKNKNPRILIGKDARQMDWLTRMLPNKYTQLFIKQFEKAGL